MNPQLHLDTSNIGVNQRYSYMETPLEMSPPGQHLARLASPPIAPEFSEKAQYVQQSTNQAYGPDIRQHPANYAPFADNISQQPQLPSATHDPPYVKPPSSPGPLPVKTNPNAFGQELNHQTIPVEPDANPLQSPKVPYFPPPATLSQPTPTSDLMTYHRPGQISHPSQKIRGGTWSHGLCECSSIGVCCLGLICPCILYGRTQHRLSLRSRKEDPTNMLGHETCNGSCTAMALLCGCQWLLATIQHTRTRRAYSIRGDIASDCVRATCCMCCTLIQDEKEIKAREEERATAARAAGATLVSPYLAPMPMSYGPPPPR
ncbi:hypothetical protein AOCH_000199 [Aspergillus ochraceoroseus]|uniref:DUF614 domain protein n=2 Tax=Aspergillus ochraceoroseus TaxID=138278 RepID=A0A0F8UK16_9EURO|nr:hypothetical protein AOCH_000199 [Aspergillus ochraceoroseus]